MKNKFFQGINKLKTQINTITTKAVNIIEDNIIENTENIISELNKTEKLPETYYSEKLKSQNEYYSISKITSNPILYIAVISFHQKKGSIIEFTYPEKEELLSNEDTLNYIKSLSISKNDTPSSIIDNINNQLTYLCLPDGSHICESDSQFFLIQNYSKILFGISTYRQLQIDQNLKEDEFENNRNCFQKSICIISKIPLFGPMASKLSVTMSAYFNQSSLKDKNIIKDLFLNYDINRFKSINILEILDSFSLKRLIFITKEKIFELIKLVMLEKNILVYSHLSHNVCSFIFSLLSIFPCNAFFNLDFEFEGNAKNYYKCYNQFGFPLKFLNKNSKLYSLLSLFDVEKLEEKNINSYLLGTTNQLFLNYNKLHFDCIINIDEEKITFNPKFNMNLIKKSKIEKNLYKEISNICQFKENENIISDNWMINNSTEMSNSENSTLFKGSDDHLRNIFFNYLNQLLKNISLIIHISKELSLDNETKINQIKKILSNYNSSFINNWISNTLNFKFWYFEHDKEIWYQSENIPYAKNILINYDNGDYYKGEISKGIPNGNGTLINHKKNTIFTYIGTFKNGKKEGVGNLFSSDHLFYYEGNWENDKKNGIGKLINNGIQYNGNFKDDLFNGFGSLICKDGNFLEGEFKEGKLFGIGHLNYKNGNIYVGNFEENLPNGKGQLTYLNGDVYYGNFLNGKKNGKGIFIMKNGDKFNGYFENDLYNGKGILNKNDGNVFKGIWKNGEFSEKVDFNDEEVNDDNINNNDFENKFFKEFEIIENVKSE